jgi:hypothetical protein
MPWAAAASAGETALSWVSETTLKLVALIDPNTTFVAAVNPVPVTVTVVPPVVGPDVGAMAVTTGTGAVSVNTSAATVELVPAGVVTEMLRAPAACAGAIAVICVPETTVNFVAATDPKRTLVAPVRPVPVMVTLVPPAVGPEDGAIAVIVGAAAWKVNTSAVTEALVPPGVMTRMP